MAKYTRLTDVYKTQIVEGGHTQAANVKNQLTQLKRNAEHLLEQVNVDLEYPAWWVNKLVKANDYLDTAHDYLNNKVDQGQGPIPKSESVVTEANKEVSVGWDMGDPKRGGLADDWQDEYGIVLSKWDKRKASITIGGDEKQLLKWLTSDYGMDKRDAQTLIRKGKRIK